MRHSQLSDLVSVEKRKILLSEPVLCGHIKTPKRRYECAIPDNVTEGQRAEHNHKKQ
jgi:hypothetical protein